MILNPGSSLQRGFTEIYSNNFAKTKKKIRLATKSEAHIEQINEKNRGQKISRYYPLNIFDALSNLLQRVYEYIAFVTINIMSKIFRVKKKINENIETTHSVNNRSVLTSMSLFYLCTYMYVGCLLHALSRVYTSTRTLSSTRPTCSSLLQRVLYTLQTNCLHKKSYIGKIFLRAADTDFLDMSTRFRMY
jgi:hypothetical protein